MAGAVAGVCTAGWLSMGVWERSTSPAVFFWKEFPVSRAPERLEITTNSALNVPKGAMTSVARSSVWPGAYTQLVGPGSSWIDGL